MSTILADYRQNNNKTNHTAKKCSNVIKISECVIKRLFITPNTTKHSNQMLKILGGIEDVVN